MTKIERMIYNSEAFELGIKHAVSIDDWEATIYSLDGKIVEEDIPSEFEAGGNEYMMFYSTKLKRHFSVSTCGDGAEFSSVKTNGYYRKIQNDHVKYQTALDCNSAELRRII